MYFNRWRAAFFTPQSYREALLRQAKRIADAIQAKQEKEQAALQAKEQRAALTAMKKEAAALARQRRAEDKALGPRTKITRKNIDAFNECNHCLILYESPHPGQEDSWTGCKHCDGRWYCGETLVRKHSAATKLGASRGEW